MKEANLLDSIGSAHMEQEIQKKVPFKFATILACCLSNLYPPSPPPPPTSPPLPAPSATATTFASAATSATFATSTTS